MIKKSLFWVAFGNIIRSVIQIIIFVIISRIIIPEDFGRLSVLMVIINFANIFNQASLAPALIQKKELSYHETSKILRFSLLISLVVGIIYLLVVPYYLEFLGQKQILIPAFFLVLFLPTSSLTLIFEVKYKRQLLFKGIVIKRTISLLVGYGFVTVVLGYLGLGIWALVIGFLSQSIFLFLMYYKEFKLIFPHSSNTIKIKHVLSFGVGNTLSTIFNYIGEEGDKFLFSRFFSVELLGAYSRSFELFTYPSRFLGNTFDTVFFPYFSQMQDDKHSLLKHYLFAIKLSFSIFLPISFLLMLYSEWFIHLMLGPQWERATIYFSILIIGLCFRFSSKISKSLLKAINEVYRLSFILLITSLIIILGIFFTIHMGSEFVAYVVTGATILNFILLFSLVLVRLRIGIGVAIKVFLPGFVVMLLFIVLNKASVVLFDFSPGTMLFLFLFLFFLLIISNPIFFLGFSLNDLNFSKFFAFLKKNL